MFNELARTVISLLYSDAVAVSIWHKNISISFNFQNVSLLAWQKCERQLILLRAQNCLLCEVFLYCCVCLLSRVERFPVFNVLISMEGRSGLGIMSAI